MTGALYKFFTEDHRRIEALMDRAVANPADIDLAVYEEFRRGLLRHIGLEEKILLPAAREARGGEPLPMAAKLRLDHGALAALTVPPPSPPILAAIRAILADHDRLEESPGGLYDTSERLMGKKADDLLAGARRAPEVSVIPYRSDRNVLETIRRAMAKAGYDFDDYHGNEESIDPVSGRLT
jgi:Hemerythrin HHE cation binding domain